MSEKLERLSRMLDIPGLGPKDARRRKLLNVILLAVVASAVLILLVLLIAVPLGIAGEQGEVRLLGLGIVILLLGAGVTYALNRYVSGELASTIFLLLLIVIAASFDEPQRVVDGRGLLVFALPILAASVLLRPWASFVAAFACALAIVVISQVVVQHPIPNAPAILILFLLALVSWLSARSLEHAMENLRAGNKLLQESEKRFKSYVENAPNGIFVTDEKGNYEVNKAAESITGYSRSELLQMNLIELFGAEDHPKAKEHFNTVAKTGKASGDFSFIKKDGSLNYWTVDTVQLSENRFLSFVTDITERKRSEDALRESEDKYRMLAENATDVVWTMDMSLRFTYISPSVLQLRGYTVDEAMVQPIDRVVVPESLGEIITLLSQKIEMIESGNKEGWTPTTFEVEQPCKDGTTVWTRNNAKIIQDSEKHPAGIIGVTHNITERKRAEEALRESEQKYRSLFETVSEGFAHHQIVLDDQGKPIDYVFLNVNHSFEKLTGLQSQNILGKRVTKVLPGIENDPADWIGIYGKVALSKEPISFEQYFEPLNRWYSVSTYSPAHLQFVTLFHDITEQVQAEAEHEQLLTQVQTQANLMRGIMNTVPEGMLLLDVDGRIVLANPVAGQALAVLVGRDDISAHEPLTHLGDRPLAELLTSPPKGLWHNVEAGGRTFEVIARPMEPTADGRSENWVMVIRDVTQERKIEQGIQQQERLAAVGQLAAGVAHDFNNIMATIVLYTKMSLNAPDLPPKIRQRLETISGQSYRATELVQQILDFSRRAVLERRPMDLTPFLKEVVKLLERTVPESIKMGLSYGSDEYTVNADPTRMQQAIVNLVVNARDAMPEGGELGIELERVQIESHQEPPLPEMEAGEWVRVRVTDTGNGIPPDVLPHIFEPFFTTKAAGKGTGLGLAQVYGIVKQHEGHTDVSTEVGAGTTFTLYLPVLLSSLPKATAPKTEVLVQGQGETLLVVEDDDALRKALTGILEQLNYRVLKAADGREALATLEQRGGEVSLVLSDLVMPEMGGQALFHALRQRGLALPVVMLSGHPMQNELEELQAQGLAGWMLKPPDMEQLSRLLARVLKDYADADAQ